MLGYVKKWYGDRGFGFVGAQDGSEYFVHITDVHSFPRELKLDQEVSFDLEETPRGWRAVNVTVVE